MNVNQVIFKSRLKRYILHNVLSGQLCNENDGMHTLCRAVENIFEECYLCDAALLKKKYALWKSFSKCNKCGTKPTHFIKYYNLKQLSIISEGLNNYN